MKRDLAGVALLQLNALVRQRDSYIGSMHENSRPPRERARAFPRRGRAPSYVVLCSPENPGTDFVGNRRHSGRSAVRVGLVTPRRAPACTHVVSDVLKLSNFTGAVREQIDNDGPSPLYGSGVMRTDGHSC